MSYLGLSIRLWIDFQFWNIESIQNRTKVKKISTQVAQLVKNPPAMQDFLVWFLGQEDPLEMGQATHSIFLGFPDGSGSKESTCTAEDLGSIPGLGRSLEEGMATHSSILAWRIPTDRGAWWATVHGGCKVSDTTKYSREKRKKSQSKIKYVISKVVWRTRGKVKNKEAMDWWDLDLNSNFGIMNESSLPVWGSSSSRYSWWSLRSFSAQITWEHCHFTKNSLNRKIILLCAWNWNICPFVSKYLLSSIFCQLVKQNI